MTDTDKLTILDIINKYQDTLEEMQSECDIHSHYWKFFDLQIDLLHSDVIDKIKKL